MDRLKYCLKEKAARMEAADVVAAVVSKTPLARHSKKRIPVMMRVAEINA